MKKIITMMLVLWMTISNVQYVSFDTVVKAESNFEVKFVQDYVSVGEPIEIIINGVEVSECDITWKSEGEIIQSGSTKYQTNQFDQQRLIEVEVSSTNNIITKQILVSDIPVIYIDVEYGQEVISKEQYQNAMIKMSGSKQYPTSVQYEGATEIKGRGNSTWELPKKPYRLKLEEKADLYGMGESKHWVLLANYLDKSLLRNQIALELGDEMGLYSVKSILVDVVLNGRKVGNYQLCEHIRVDQNRVNIYDWEKTAEDLAKAVAKKHNFDKSLRSELEDDLISNLSWITSGTFTFYPSDFMLDATTIHVSDYIELPNPNGGYLIELDETMDELTVFTSSLNQPMMVKSPEYLYTNQTMLNNLKDYINLFEAAIQNSKDFTVTHNQQSIHYSDLFDMDALLSYFLIQEIFFNYDAMKRSTYMYQDVDGKMMMGPVWDFDFSSGNEQVFEYYDRWETLYFAYDTQAKSWYKYLIQDPYFIAKLRNQYLKYRDVLETIIENGGKIDTYEAILKASGSDNAKIWHDYESYTSKVSDFKNWMTQRIEWLDAQFLSNKSLATSLQLADYEEIGITLLQNNKTIGQNEKGSYCIKSDVDVVLQLQASYDLYINESYYGEVHNGSVISADVLNEDEMILVLKAKDNTVCSYVLEKHSGDVEVVDRTLLMEVLAKSESALLHPEFYTKESMELLNAVHKQAKLMMEQENPSQSDIDEMIILLNNAYNELVEQDRIQPLDPKFFYIKDITSSSIALEWSSSESDDVAYYELVSLPSYDILTQLNTTTYVLEGLSPNTSGKVILYIYDISGNRSNGIELEYTTLSKIKEPSKVENVKAEDTNYKTITLTWDVAEHATAYDVYRKAYDSDEFKLYKTVEDTTLAVSGVMTGKEYAFYVVAKNDSYVAEASETVAQATTLQGKVTLAIESVSTSTFKLSWNKIDGAPRYIVYRKRNDDKMKKVLTLGAKDLEYTTAELPHGDYEFVLKAGRYDSTNRVMSDASNTVAGSVEKVAPVVTLNAATKSIKVSWNKMEGVTYYQVYRATSIEGKYTKLITTKETSCTAKALSSGKKYFFKVRGYKTYKSGETIKYAVYTPYSTIKYATAK